MHEILLNHEDFYNLLCSKEYEPYLLFYKGIKGIVYLNLETLPRDKYLPINGNYCKGFILVQKINNILEKGISGITIKCIKGG